MNVARYLLLCGGAISSVVWVGIALGSARAGLGPQLLLGLVSLTFALVVITLRTFAYPSPVRALGLYGVSLLALMLQLSVVPNADAGALEPISIAGMTLVLVGLLVARRLAPDADSPAAPVELRVLANPRSLPVAIVLGLAAVFVSIVTLSALSTALFKLGFESFQITESHLFWLWLAGTASGIFTTVWWRRPHASGRRTPRTLVRAVALGLGATFVAIFALGTVKTLARLGLQAIGESSFLLPEHYQWPLYWLWFAAPVAAGAFVAARWLRSQQLAIGVLLGVSYTALTLAPGALAGDNYTTVWHVVALLAAAFVGALMAQAEQPAPSYLRPGRHSAAETPRPASSTQSAGSRRPT